MSDMVESYDVELVDSAWPPNKIAPLCYFGTSNCHFIILLEVVNWICVICLLDILYDKVFDEFH